jgi:hypothetical protein
VLHLPIKEAGRRLGLGTTSMKRVRSRFEFKRWPYRQLASLNDLIAKFERYCAEQAGGGDEAQEVLRQLRCVVWREGSERCRAHVLCESTTNGAPQRCA